MSGPTTKRVRLDRPGVLACGPYRAGEEYELPVEEAERMIRDKGFVEIKPGRDARTASEED